MSECSVSNPGDKMMAAMTSKHAAKLSLDEIIKHFRTDPVFGLNEGEVERRRNIHGLNEFDVVEDKPLWRKYIDQVYTRNSSYSYTLRL